jgi:hypothetical protein
MKEETQAMYRLNDTDGWRERRREPMEGPGSVTRLSARPKEAARPGTRTRIVRLPGGFAFVEDRTAVGRS